MCAFQLDAVTRLAGRRNNVKELKEGRREGKQACRSDLGLTVNSKALYKITRSQRAITAAGW